MTVVRSKKSPLAPISIYPPSLLYQDERRESPRGIGSRAHRMAALERIDFIAAVRLDTRDMGPRSCGFGWNRPEGSENYNQNKGCVRNSFCICAGSAGYHHRTVGPRCSLFNEKLRRLASFAITRAYSVVISPLSLYKRQFYHCLRTFSVYYHLAAGGPLRAFLPADGRPR